MNEKQQLCEKITEIYPEIGECGINVKAEFNESEKAWEVDLKKDDHHLKTFLDKEDAAGCIEGKKCVNLGIQIAQLKENIEKV